MTRLPPLSSWSLRASFVTPPGLLTLLLLGGCTGGEELILPGDGQPAAIAVVEGDGQSGTVGEPLADPLVVEVTDARGRPVEGAPVVIEFTSAGPGASVIPDTTETNAAGRADARLVLGTSIGTQTGRARVVTAEGRDPVTATFSALAFSESANRIAAVAGEDQTGHVGQPLDDLLVVEVTDGFGNPVEGVPISWSVEGGGSVSAATVETGEDGRARVDRVLGPALGRQATLATSSGLAGSPVTFVHTAIAGDASRLVIVAGNGQTAAAGSTLPVDLVVQLVDADGNGVPRAALSWVVATGGGTAVPVNTATNDEGLATTRWTLGETLGEQRIDAVVSGVGFISFRATATAVVPPSLFIQTQPSASARNGVPFDRQPVIQVRDGSGNNVAAAGIQVRAALGSGGGELLGTLVRGTDASGRATFTDLAISGDAGTRTLSFTAEGYAGVTSSEINVAAAPVTPTTTAITADLPDPSAAGTTITVNFQVTAVGATPTGSVTVSVSGGTPTCTGSLSGGAGSCQLTLNIVGDRTLTATYSGAPGFSASSDTEAHRVEQNPPPSRSTVTTITSDAPDPSTAGTSFAVGFRVSAEGATPTGNVTVTVSGGTPSCTGTLSDGAGSCSLTLNTVGDRTLTATYSGAPGFLGSSGTAPHRVELAPQPNLQIDQQPSGSATVGQPFDRQPRIQLRAGNENVQQAGVTISAEIASGGGTLGGSLTATTDGNGRAQFSNLSISGAEGPHTLRFTAPGFGEVISNPISVEKAKSKTRFTSFDPSEPTVGQTVRVSFEVTADNGGGTPTGSVMVTIDDGLEPGCTGSVADGFCELSFATDGDRHLSATYQGDDQFGGSSAEDNIQVDPAPSLAPVAVDESYATPSPAGSELSVGVNEGVLANDTDADTPHDFLVVNLPLVQTTPGGTLEMDVSGSFQYTPNAGTTTDTFRYQARDPQGNLSNIATVTITITP